MADESKKNIIIKKVVSGGHGGHHGGAWKVAYADFVTAMMAFFLLLWLLSSAPKESLKEIAQYFTPTIGIKDAKGIGFEGGASPTEDGTKRSDLGADSVIFGGPTQGSIIDNIDNNKKTADDQNFLDSETALNKMIETDKVLKEFSDQIMVDMTPEGLRIRIVDSKERPMFEPNTSNLLPHAKLIISKIIPILKYLPNYISISGHTAFSAKKDSGLWDLSANRANSTRKYFEESGIDPEQIGQLKAFADRLPFNNDDLNDPRNVRIEVIILKKSVMAYNKPNL